MKAAPRTVRRREVREIRLSEDDLLELLGVPKGFELVAVHCRVGPAMDEVEFAVELVERELK